MDQKVDVVPLLKKAKSSDAQLTSLVDSEVVEQYNKDGFWLPDRQKFMMMFYFAGTLILYAARTAMALCMPQIQKDFGWDKKQQGLVLACFLWGYPVTQILGGYLSDRLGPDRVLITASAGWAVITFLTPWFPYMMSGDASSALSLMIFARIVQGLFQGFYFPSVMSMMSKRVIESERTFTFSVIGAGSHGGTLFVGLFGSAIIRNYGWAFVFYAIGLLGLAWVISLSYVADSSQKPVPVKDNLSQKVVNPPTQPIVWGKVVRMPPFWAMMIAHFSEGYTYFVFLFWLPTFFHENYPDAEPWVYNVLPWLVDMIVSIAGGMLANYMLKKGVSKTHTRKILNIFAMLGMGLGLILISTCSSYHCVLFFVCMAATGHGFYQSTVLMNPSDLAPDHTGLVFGVMNTFGAIPGFLGTYISGAILDATHDWNLMYMITGTVTSFGWAVFAYWGTSEPIIP